MPNDPDFHHCADTWLGGTGEDGQRRVLREILRDSPDAAGEFAPLARAEAALQLAGLTQSERLQRARALIQPSFRTGIRRLINRPALRWSAAAALLIGGILWLVLHGDAGDATGPGKSRLAPVIQRAAPPVLVKSTVPPEKLPPADKDFVRRMSRFVIPDFRVTGVPIAEALDKLKKSIAAIDATAVPDFSAAENLPDNLTVHLQVAYYPVAVLLDLIAIQTGTSFQASGKGYAISGDPKAPMPGAIFSRTYESPPGGIPGVDDMLFAGPEPHPGFWEANSATLLGEKPELAHVRETAMELTASERMHRLVERMRAASLGTRPGTWTCKTRAVSVSGPEAKAKLAALGARHTFTEPEFEVFMRQLNQMKGVDILTVFDSPVPPGVSVEDHTGGNESPDPDNRPDDWTGFRIAMTNHPAGDTGGQARISINAQTPDKAAGPEAMHRFNVQATWELADAQPSLIASYTTPDDSLNAIFLTGQRDPVQEDLPYGIPVVGKKGFVHSPYAEDKGMVDVEGLKRGTRVQCPYTQKHFRVP